MNYGMDYAGDGGASGGGGFGTQTQTQSGGRARRSYDEQTCIPVTVNMILNANAPSEDEATGALVLNDGTGRKLYHGRLVGAIRSVDETSTSIVYEIEDGTGLIQVKQWIDDNDCSALVQLRQQTVRDNIYVKIVGQVKDYDGRKMVVADSIRPLSTGNELTHHMLEVVYSGEISKKRSKAQNSLPSAYGMGSGVGFSGPMGGGRPLASASLVGSGGGALSDEILDYVRNNDIGDQAIMGGGVAIEPFVQQVVRSGKYSEVEVRDVIYELANSGQIYTTSNENHYRCSL